MTREGSSNKINGIVLGRLIHTQPINEEGRREGGEKDGEYYRSKESKAFRVEGRRDLEGTSLVLTLVVVAVLCWWWGKERLEK